jgi:hypothetical protein
LRHGFVPPAYRWLQDHLASRLPDYQGRLPWWVHCQKPDLRRHRHATLRGVVEVRLELELASGTFLTFPSWAWDCIFRQDYLALTREEYDQWTNRLRTAVPNEDAWPLPEPWQSQLKASWGRLFDANLPVLGWDPAYAWSRHPRVEGVVETLRLVDVQTVTHFTGTLELPAGPARQRLESEARDEHG